MSSEAERGGQLPGGAGARRLVILIVAMAARRRHACSPGADPRPSGSFPAGWISRRLFTFPVKTHPLTPRSERGPSSLAELPPPARPVSQRTARAPPGSAGWGTAARSHTPQPGPGSPMAAHPDATPLLTELVTQRPPGRTSPPQHRRLKDTRQGQGEPGDTVSTQDLQGNFFGSASPPPYP